MESVLIFIGLLTVAVSNVWAARQKQTIFVNVPALEVPVPLIHLTPTLEAPVVNVEAPNVNVQPVIKVERVEVPVYVSDEPERDKPSNDLTWTTDRGDTIPVRQFPAR